MLKLKDIRLKRLASQKCKRKKTVKKRKEKERRSNYVFWLNILAVCFRTYLTHLVVKRFPQTAENQLGKFLWFLTIYLRFLSMTVFDIQTMKYKPCACKAK